MTDPRLVENYEVWDDRFYSPRHMWIKLELDEHDLVRVGLDDYLQQSLGLITRIDLPEIGSGPTGPLARVSVTQKVCEGEVCQYRTTSVELPFPIDGEVVAINEDLLVDPFLAQEDHAGRGWLVQLRLGAAGRAQLVGLYQGKQVEDWLRDEVRAGARAYPGELILGR